MPKKIVFIVIILTSILSFSQNIKSITEFKKDGDSLVKNKWSIFDKSGNLVREVNYGKFDSRLNTFRNKIRTIEYKNGQRVSEYVCEDFVSKDTCIIRSFSTFKYNPQTNIEIETFFEADSTIRFIREFRKDNDVAYETIYSWEFNPTKNPDFNKAAIMTDTILYDKQNREVKRLNYSSFHKNKVTEIIKYSESIYTKEIMGTEKDTILEFQIHKLQSLADKNNIEYRFRTELKYDYEIEYW